MNRKIVAIDCGKAETKVYAYDTANARIRDLVIRSKAEHTKGLVKMSAKDKAHVVTFRNPLADMEGEWIVGANGGATSYSNSKKDHIHKILTMLAIALMTENGDFVIPSIGCPLSVFSNDPEKDAYLDYIFPDGRVDMTVDGRERYFYIEKSRSLVFPESYGALFLYEDKFTDKTGVIDIGGLNVNASCFQKGVLNPFESKTEKLGYYSLISHLRTRLNAVCDASFDYTDTELFLRQGYVTNNKETAKVVEEVLDTHVMRIKDLLKEWDLISTTLIFIGGTSKLLQHQIERHFGKKIILPEDANLINCRGFLKAMLDGYGYKSEI